MKIEFLTHDDPHYTLPFFEEFVRHYGEAFEIVQISCCRAMGNRSRTALARALLCLYGPAGFVSLCLRVVLGRLLSLAPRGREARKFYSIGQLGRAFGIPVEPVEDPNGTAYMEGMRRRGADVIVSVACPFILKERLLSAPPLGCINIHHAPLPRYRGMMPTFWQLYHRERTVGLTIHYMSARLDAGGALLQDQMEVEPGEPLERLIRRSKRRGAHCMAEVLRRLEAQSQPVIRLDEAAASYFTFPTLEQIREFRRRGYRAS